MTEKQENASLHSKEYMRQLEQLKKMPVKKDDGPMLPPLTHEQAICPFCHTDNHDLPDDFQYFIDDDVHFIAVGKEIDSSMWIGQDTDYHHRFCCLDSDGGFWQAPRINYCPICGRKLA